MRYFLKRRKTRRSETQLPQGLYLPDPIVFEILSRVGIKTLFNCCLLVCKSWAKLISSPDFAQLHLSRSPTSCLIECRSKSIPDLIDPQYPYSIQNNLVFIPEINLPDSKIVFTNSCNGFVCFIPRIPRNEFVCFEPRLSPSFKITSNIYVCNPILRECITIQKPSHVAKFDRCCCAIGFSHKTNEYKVICINKRVDYYRAAIYTLGEGSWRSINVGNERYFMQNQYFNASVNGAIHWIPVRSSHPIICCFDFVTEEFRSVPEPSEFGPLEKEFRHKMKVGVINGNLSVCDYRNSDHTEIWVMKDYGVKESWSKDFVINHVFCERKSGPYELILITGNDEVLVRLQNYSVKLYDPKSQDFKGEAVSSSSIKAIAYIPSLISLKDVSKGENLKALGKATKASLFCGNKDE